jgi:hypothetical protein
MQERYFINTIRKYYQAQVVVLFLTVKSTV